MDIIKRAIKTNVRRSSYDRKSGFAAPEDTSILIHLRTAKEAIEAGIRIKDWNCIAEGFVMIEEVCKRMEGKL